VGRALAELVQQMDRRRGLALAELRALASWVRQMDRRPGRVLAAAVQLGSALVLELLLVHQTDQRQAAPVRGWQARAGQAESWERRQTDQQQAEPARGLAVEQPARGPVGPASLAHRQMDQPQAQVAEEQDVQLLAPPALQQMDLRQARVPAAGGRAVWPELPLAELLPASRMDQPQAAAQRAPESAAPVQLPGPATWRAVPGERQTDRLNQDGQEAAAEVNSARRHGATFPLPRA
jgi:hypothetical protein